MISGSNPGIGARDFSPICPDQLWGPPGLLFNGHWGLFPGVKQPGCAVNHSPPSSAEVKNGWSYTSTPTVCFHGMDKENFY